MPRWARVTMGTGGAGARGAAGGALGDELSEEPLAELSEEPLAEAKTGGPGADGHVEDGAELPSEAPAAYRELTRRAPLVGEDERGRPVMEIGRAGSTGDMLLSGTGGSAGSAGGRTTSGICRVEGTTGGVGDGEEDANGKTCSWKRTWRDVRTRREVRSKQRKPR